MKVDYLELHRGMEGTGAAARGVEKEGYDGFWTAETRHDPFMPLALAAEHTSTIELGTAIALAFARNPMITANIGWDLQQFSDGRMCLGLGSQIRTHIEKRFSMPWSQPAARMREFVSAMRAIWDCWQNGTKLAFRGDFYQHTIMTPMFDPGPSDHGAPLVFVAALGEQMTEVAGEVADGILIHGFTTERYFREVTLPAIERGLAKSGRSHDDFQIGLPLYAVMGYSDETWSEASTAIRRQLAFYGSTPAYRPVLDRMGWGDLQTELNILSKRGEWEQMGELIDDEKLAELALVGDPSTIVDQLRNRYGHSIDRVSFGMPYPTDPAMLGELLTKAQGI